MKFISVPLSTCKFDKKQSRSKSIISPVLQTEIRVGTVRLRVGGYITGNILHTLPFFNKHVNKKLRSYGGSCVFWELQCLTETE